MNTNERKTMNTNERKTAEAYHGRDALDRQAETMIERLVLQCQTCLVDSILGLVYDWGSNGYGWLPTWDDVANGHENRCPDCGELTTEADTDADDWDGQDHRCTSCEWTGDYPNSDPQEVMEWWLVDSWLGDRLKELGHVILTDGQSTWWGRCCTGQGIILDGIMQRIVVETGWQGWPEGQLTEGPA